MPAEDDDAARSVEDEDDAITRGEGEEVEDVIHNKRKSRM